MDSLIYFNDLTASLEVERFQYVENWIHKTCLNEGFKLGELLLVFCDDDYLHKINVDYLNHDTLTDVITFDYSNDEFISGEIYISLERIQENAQDLNSDSTKELNRIMIHGILHLLGYHDKDPQDKIQMTSKEDYYLSLLPEF